MDKNDRTVSLNAVIKALDTCFDAEYAKAVIKQLPSISNEDILYNEYMRGYDKGKASVSQPKKGHWIIKGHNLGDDYIEECYVCSKCGEQALLYPYGRHLECLSNFCPNCGSNNRRSNNRKGDKING